MHYLPIQCTIPLWNKSLYIALIAFVCTLYSCSENAESILEQSIEAHGGMSAYHNLDTIMYEKAILYFDKHGKSNKEIQETHAFIYQPEFAGLIISVNDDEVTESMWKSKFLNQSINGEQIENPKNPFPAEIYELNMPWTLADNTDLFLEGDTIIADKPVYILRVDSPTDDLYSDRWVYIHKTDYTIVAQKIISKSNQILLIIENFKLYNGLLFTQRKSAYSIDSSDIVQHKIAEYIYKF